VCEIEAETLLVKLAWINIYWLSSLYYSHSHEFLCAFSKKDCIKCGPGFGAILDKDKNKANFYDSCLAIDAFDFIYPIFSGSMSKPL